MLTFNLAQTSKYKRFQQEFIDLGKIGSGGFAHVHRVRSKLDHQQYALKIIQIKPNNCRQDIIELIHRFLQQVKILSFLNHKNIIQYYGCWFQCQQNNNVEQLDQLKFKYQQQKNQQSQQIQMIVEDQQLIQSGGIQFACSQNDKNNLKQNQKNRNSSIFQKQHQINQTNYDHSQASTLIRKKYKLLKIYILSQLCQGNVQAYLYKRNMSRKDRKGHKIFSQKDQLLQNYKMIIQIIQGLQYLHSKKIIHRDIKLHNIVFDNMKKCKIIDYGLAKKTRMLNSISQYPNQLKLDDQNNVQQVFSSSVGTKIYSSPQQINSQRYDHRTDIYSLAIVILLFFCDFTTTHEQLKNIQKIRKIDLNFIKCDQRLKNILIKCLGQQKNRPRIVQIKKIVKILLRERYQRQSRKLSQNSNQIRNVLQKQQNIYVFQNSKLKKKYSKQEYQAHSKSSLKISDTHTKDNSQEIKVNV